MNVKTVSCKGGCGDLLRTDSIAVINWYGYCDDCVINKNIDIGLINYTIKYEDDDLK